MTNWRSEDFEKQIKKMVNNRMIKIKKEVEDLMYKYCDMVCELERKKRIEQTHQAT